MTAKKKTPTKKKKINPAICKLSPNKKHCFHSPAGNSWSYTISNSWIYPQLVDTCCWCGQSELILHGKYHPKVPYKSSISGGTITGNTGAIVIDGITTTKWVNNNNAEMKYTPTMVQDTLGKLSQNSDMDYECSSDCGCKQPIVIKKPQPMKTA